jgi:hypothetical protein
MFKIAQFQAAQLALAKQVTAVEELRNDPELKRELEFDTELEGLLAKYSMSKDKLYSFMSAQYAAIRASEKKTPGAAKEKKTTGHANRLWTNPHTGEAVKSRRRDHSVLLRWAEQHGMDTVLTWAQPI